MAVMVQAVGGYIVGGYIQGWNGHARVRHGAGCTCLAECVMMTRKRLLQLEGATASCSLAYGPTGVMEATHSRVAGRWRHDQTLCTL